MAQYIAYDDLILGMADVQRYWPLTDLEFPLQELVAGDPSITDRFTLNAAPMFGSKPSAALTAEDHEYGPAIGTGNGAIQAINTAQQFTVAFWLMRVMNDTGYYYLAQIERSGKSSLESYLNDDQYWPYPDSDYYSQFSLPAGEPHSFVLTHDGARLKLFVDSQQRLDTGDAWADLTTLQLYHYGQSVEDVVMNYFALFSRALTLDEITEMELRARFQGKIAGTVTLDGAPNAATLRAFRRSDGVLAGEAQAAADGTYELMVSDNVQMDLLAIPPDGVAARPLAHGPIIPEPYE